MNQTLLIKEKQMNTSQFSDERKGTCYLWNNRKKINGEEKEIITGDWILTKEDEEMKAASENNTFESFEIATELVDGRRLKRRQVIYQYMKL